MQMYPNASDPEPWQIDVTNGDTLSSCVINNPSEGLQKIKLQTIEDYKTTK